MCEPWHTSQISILQEYSEEKCKVGVQEILKGWKKNYPIYPMKHEYHFLRCTDYFKEKKIVKKLFQASTKLRDMHYMEALL